MTATPGTLAVAGGVSVALTALMWVLARTVARTPRTGWIGPRMTPGPCQLPVFMLLPAVPVFPLLDRGFTAALLPALLLLVFGIPAAMIDARELRLPNELTYGLVVTATVAVGILTASGVPGSVVRALLCGVGYAGALLAIAVFTPTGQPRGAEAGTAPLPVATALGLGDIKLAAGLGVVLGWTSLPALIAAVAVTAATHFLWIIGCTVARRAGQGSGMSGTALGPWMVLGAMVALYLAVPQH